MLIGHIGQIAMGIWSPMSTKFSILLWRLKWNQILATCLLYISRDESRSYLVFNCFYSRAMLLPFAETLNHFFLEDRKYSDFLQNMMKQDGKKS